MPAKQFEEQSFQKRATARTILLILKEAARHPLLFSGMVLFVLVTSFNHNYTTYLKKIMIDKGLLEKNLDLFVSNLILYIVLFAVMAGTFLLFFICAGYLCERIQYNIRKKMFRHMQNLPFSFFDRTPTGWILSRMTTDTTRLSELGTWMLLDIIWAATNLLFALFFMFILDVMLSLIVLAVVPLLIVIAARFKRLILQAYRKVQASTSGLSGKLHENISGVRIIKSLVREERQLADFAAQSGEMYSSGFKAAFLSSLLLPIIQFAAMLLIAAILYYSGLYTPAADSSLTIGVVQAFIGYIIFIIWPIQELARVFAQMQRSVAGAERIFSFLETKPGIAETTGAAAMTRLRGDIEFRDVDFYYDTGAPVLSHFSLKIQAGTTTALVGRTGGGKTTIVNLLCRFLEPRSGQILIDGRDYRTFSLRSLHAKTGIILQQAHLFSGTIKENIRYGRLNATDEEIYAAARMSHADEFIRKLPQGYDAEVGEGGNLLSVGQKQLISLSRAILVNPVLLIMDEATSAVDLLTEELIRKAMQEFQKHCTCFIIAHRLATIQYADRILVIDHGKIIEDGTHNELIVKGGKYFELYTNQFRLEKEKAGAILAPGGLSI